MVDVLDASGANRPKAGLITTPSSTISPEEMVRPTLEAAQGLRGLGQALGTLGEQIDMAAVPAAQAAGLAAVGRDENGEPTVELRPFALSASDRAFNAAATQGLLSKTQMDAQRGLQEISAKYPSDPAGFDAEAKAYVRNLGAGTRDLRPLLQAEADKIRQQHFLSISNAAVKRQTAGAKDAVLVQIDTTTNELLALARKGGTETEEYRAASEKLGALYTELKNNPTFEVSPARAESEFQNTVDRARGFGMAGEAVRVFDAQGEKAAQKWLVEAVRDNPDLKITEAQRTGLLEIGRNAIAMRKGENKALVDANKAAADVLAKALEDGKAVPPGSIEAAIDTATKLGDTETAAKLITSRQVYGRSEFARGLSDEERVRLATGAAVAPAGVGAIITDTAGRYGLSPQFLAKMAHIESRFDPNAVNAGSKATGLFQFIPSTWRQYGGGANARDPAANADAAARLTIANRNQLRASLGRDPTEGELYLAHQQGAGGASQLLGNPNARAVDIVGERAVLGNGGNLNMTAGQFAQLWIRKFDGASGEVPAAPFTPQQLAENPYLGSTWLRAQMSGNKDLIDSARYVMSAASNAIDKGSLPDAQTLAGALQIAEQNPSELGRNRDELVAKIRGFDEGQEANRAGGSAGALLVQDAMRRAQGAPIFVQMQAAATKDAVERGARNLKEQPWDEAVRRGWARNVPAPLDMSEADSLAAGFAMRAELARAIASRTGEAGRSVLAPDDVAQVSNVWSFGTADQKSAVLAAISRLPDEMIEPTLRSLGEDKQSGQFAFVAGLHRESSAAALAVIRGQQAILANPRLAPKPEEWKADAIERSLPLSITAPERGVVREYIGAAVKSVYAGLSARDGDESGSLNDQRLSEAVGIVTGGLVEHNGSKLIPPTRGMTQDQFDRALQSLGDTDFAGAATKSGQRVTARDVRRNFVLRGVADGRYALQARNSPGEWLYSPPVLGRDIDNTVGGYAGEQRFILDLKGRGEAPNAAPQAYVPNFAGAMR